MTIRQPGNAELPGRMYNRSLGDFDPFLVEHHQPRRRLQQVSSYHDLDDIPTVPTYPDAKGAVGCAVNSSRKRMGSPNCVADVKHFDPIAFRDENNGVSIDLCVTETIEEDDLFLLHEQSLLLEQQRRDEPEQDLPAEPMPSLGPRSSVVLPKSTATSLAPIFEERRVTFAAQHVVLRVDDADSLANDQRLVHQVFDAVQVWFIPHHTEYTEEVRADLWYKPAEMAAMKEQASEFRRTRRRQRRSLQRAARDPSSDESGSDACSFFRFDRAAATEGEEFAELTRSERRSLYLSMVNAVLHEQHEQRRKCLRVYGRIDEGRCAILDTDRLAEVCATAGDTRRSAERALCLAEALLEEEKESDANEDISHAPTLESRKHRGPPKRSSSFQGSAALVETSVFVDESIAAVFRALLAPFLEIRRGDLFLGIGEEMSVPMT